MEPVNDSSRLFRFKRFEMINDLAGLKVGTDGVLLGAWAATEGAIRSVWDVGTGTGVVALMIAQRCAEAIITGYESEPQAADVAEANFNRSPWSDRMLAVKGDVMQHHERFESPDLIVSNPPYFEASASLAATGEERNKARRTVTLDYSAVIRLAAMRLSPSGRLCLVLPAEMLSDVEWQATLNGLSLSRLTLVATKEGKKPLRMLCELSRRGNGVCIKNDLSIRDRDGVYTADYISLTRDFYLNF